MTKKYATRLKFTATIAAGQITSLTVAAAAYKGRSLQAAIDAGNANNDATAIKVGDTAIEFMVESQTTGDWEEAEYTITSGSVITKTKVLASSNAGAAVSFPAGTVDVYSTPSGSWLRRVLTIDDGVDIASLPTLNPSSLPSATPLGSYTIPVRDPASGLAYNLAVSAMMSAYAPAQTINVSTPNTQVAGAAFSVSGFYANGTPTALDWSIDGGTTWNVAASPTIASGAFTITGVTVPTANATQNVKVRDHATGVIGTSGSFVVSAAATAPGQVTGLTLGTATDTTQALSWAAPSTGTAPFTYKIEYSADNSNWAVFGSPVSGTSATVTGLTASKLYYYRVSAINSVNTGTASTVASGSTTAAPTVVPGQVTGLTAGTPTDTTQPLSWTAVATADSYIVEKSISGANSWSVVASGITSTSYTVTGLVQSTAYDYRVTAKNTAGNGTPSATVTKSTAATVVAQTVGVDTPPTATSYRAYTLTGTWTGTQPTALEYRTTDNGGTPTAWASLAGATINANGTWSASVTPTTYAASRVMSVRDASTQVAGSSGAYTVLSMAQAYRLTNTNGSTFTGSTTAAVLSSPDYYGAPTGSPRVNVRDANGVPPTPAQVKVVFGLYNDPNCPVTNFSQSGLQTGANGTAQSGGHINGFVTTSALGSWSSSTPNSAYYGTMNAASMNAWFGTGSPVGAVTSGQVIDMKFWVVFIDGSTKAHDDNTGTPLKYSFTVP